MAVIDTFSYRQRMVEGKHLDVFVYDKLPKSLRVQIIYIWRRAIGHSGFTDNDAWYIIHNWTAENHGLFKLSTQSTYRTCCEQYLLETNCIPYALDIIELSFRYIHAIARKFDQWKRRDHGITAFADDAISDLNDRFRRAGVGYTFNNGILMRIDSELIHAEVVKPSLMYLNNPGFTGPKEEFLKAYTHYREGRTKEAIVGANNAFESTLKAICDQRQLEYQSGARASDLLKLVRNANLLPNYLDNSFDQLMGTLQTGLPKVRNEEAAHGDGSVPSDTPRYIAAYALHLAAATILLLTEAHEDTK